MAHQATVIRIMIASPSDVSAERGVIRAVIHEWNDVQPADAGVVLLPVGWETHSSPDLSAPAQELINDRFLKDCDLLVGLFSTRLGTPTEKSLSGSAEEIERHLDAQKPAMIYFSEVAVPRSLLGNAQLDDLARFRTLCEGRGIVWTFNDTTDLREKFSRHLRIALNQDPLRELVGARKTSGLIGSATATVSPPGAGLSDESKHLLVTAASDPSGVIVKTRTLAGQHIHVNGQTVGPQETHRDQMAAEDALIQLVDNQLVIPRGSDGEIFEVTKKGYALSDQLRIASSVSKSATRAWPILTSEAIALLAATAKDPAGVLLHVKRPVGTVVRVSGQDFIRNESPRTAATWSAAVDELVTHHLLENRGGNANYYITKYGYEIADALTD